MFFFFFLVLVYFLFSTLSTTVVQPLENAVGVKVMSYQTQLGNLLGQRREDLKYSQIWAIFDQTFFGNELSESFFLCDSRYVLFFFFQRPQLKQY